MDDKPVAAVVLSAGMSTRIGTVKQLLKLNESYLLEMVLSHLQFLQIQKIYVVVGYEGGKIRTALTSKVKDPRITWIHNLHYAKGQGTSLTTGIEAACKEGYKSIMIFLSDQPFIERTSLEAVWHRGVERMKVEKDPFAVRPFYQGNPGHPVFMGNVVCHQTHMEDGDSAGKSMLKRLTGDVEKVNVDDPFVCFDIDTKEDYEFAKKIVTANWNGVTEWSSQ